jgi:hypothetical protein
MGVYSAVGSLTLCLAPFWSLNALDMSTLLAFGATGVSFVVAVILLLAFWTRTAYHPDLDKADRVTIQTE